MDYFDFHHHHITRKNGIYNAVGIEVPPNIPFSVGIHPMEIPTNWELLIAEMEKIARIDNCLTIGECGFDARSGGSLDLQMKVFSEQIDVANRVRKPIVIHCVKRYDALIPFTKQAKIPMIIHGFNKNEQLAKSLIYHGFMLSFGAKIGVDKALQKVMFSVGVEHLLLETDTQNIPISEVYCTAAEVFGKDEKWLIEKINHNLEKIGIK